MEKTVDEWDGFDDQTPYRSQKEKLLDLIRQQFRLAKYDEYGDVREIALEIIELTKELPE